MTETLPTPGWKEEKFNIYWTLKWSIFLLSMSPHELCVPVLQHLELQAEESESGGGEDVPGQDADTLPGRAAADTLSGTPITSIVLFTQTLK